MSDQLGTEPLLWLFVSIACLALIIASVGLFYGLINARRFSATKRELNRQLVMMQAGVQGVGSRVLELESRLASLRQSQNDLSTSTQDLAYSKAKSLINEGMSDDAIAETSGLTLSEVGLMKLVHSRSSLAQNTAIGV